MDANGGQTTFGPGDNLVSAMRILRKESETELKNALEATLGNNIKRIRMPVADQRISHADLETPNFKQQNIGRKKIIKPMQLNDFN